MNTFSLILLTLILVSGVSLRAKPASDNEPIHLKADIVYKTTAEKDLHLDLFYPATELVGAYPLVVYTHGGGWAAGSKNKAQGRSNIARTVRGLTEAGFCVAAVEYRLCNQGDTSIRDCVTDAMDAVRYLAKHGEALHLDSNRVFAYGDSAGGQLAQMLLLTQPDDYLSYKAPPAIGKAQKDPTHTANFGVKLQERCLELGLTCELMYPGASNVRYKNPTDYLIATLKPPAVILGARPNVAQQYVPEEGSDELTKKRRKEKPVKMDPSLPNVLIIGDSISIGYTGQVRAQLEGNANVIHNPENAQGTTLGLAKLQEWLGDTTWDVIHFNWGLHDLKHVTETGENSNNPDDPQQTDLATYTANLEVLVQQLKATGAKLIFATTTPYPKGVKPCRLPEDAAKYNAAALKIMKANNIEVNDLYSLALPKLETLQRRRNVHFEKEGSQVLADQVVAMIQSAL